MLAIKANVVIDVERGKLNIESLLSILLAFILKSEFSQVIYHLLILFGMKTNSLMIC